MILLLLVNKLWTLLLMENEENRLKQFSHLLKYRTILFLFLCRSRRKKNHGVLFFRCRKCNQKLGKLIKACNSIEFRWQRFVLLLMVWFLSKRGLLNRNYRRKPTTFVGIVISLIKINFQRKYRSILYNLNQRNTIDLLDNNNQPNDNAPI
jgi:hypothetical protein